MKTRSFISRSAVVTTAVAGAFALGILVPALSAQAPQPAPQGGRGQAPAAPAPAAPAPAAPQGGGRGGGAAGGRGQAPATPQAAAPADLTGVWVSAITEDWRFRMVTAPRGDFASIPLNPEGTRVGNMWDPAADVAAGEQCRAYGAAGLMRLPTRLRISWENATTLKVEADAGTQTRLFMFPAPAAPNVPTTAVQMGAPSWQGYSVANWETQAEGSGAAAGGGGRGGGGGAPALSGSLKIVTTNLRPGYHRRNGPPYSGNTNITEFFDRTNEPNGDSWLIVTSIIEDPTYLNGPLMNSSQFKREPDASKFSPSACEVGQPVGPEPAAGRGGRGAAAPAAPPAGAPAAPAGRGGRGN